MYTVSLLLPSFYSQVFYSKLISGLCLQSVWYCPLFRVSLFFTSVIQSVYFCPLFTACLFLPSVYSQSDTVPPVPTGGPALGPVEDGPPVGLHCTAVSRWGPPHPQLHQHLLWKSEGVIYLMISKWIGSCWMEPHDKKKIELLTLSVLKYIYF